VWIQQEAGAEEVALTLNSLRTVLQKPPRDRSPRSIHALMQFTHSIKFFKDLVHEQSEAAHFQCCLHMKYEQIPANEWVFRQGDTGSKFYIVLEGLCAVLAPENKQDEGYVEIARCGPGDCFGELALFRNANRAASVMCLAESHFAVLSRDEFSRLVGKVKEAMLEAKVNFLSKFPFFATRGKGDMQRISYYFKEHTYKRKQQVFTLGEPCSSLYFIREGEFQVLESLPTAKSSPILRGTKLIPRLIEFKILTTNQVFGEEDIHAIQGKREYAVVCHSAVGVLLVIARQDFVARVGSEEAFEYLKRVSEQKKWLRQRRLETVTELERVQNRKSEERVSFSHTSHTVSPAKLPLLPLQLHKSLKKMQLSTSGGMNESIGVLLTSGTDCTPGKKLVFPLSNECKTERNRPGWDELLRIRRAEKERKLSPRLLPKSVVNIHTHHKPTRHLPISFQSLPSAPINIVTPIDSERIRDCEQDLYI